MAKGNSVEGVAALIVDEFDVSGAYASAAVRGWLAELERRSRKRFDPGDLPADIAGELLGDVRAAFRVLHPRG